MIYRLIPDFVVLSHLGFILFAAFGGLLVLKYPRCALLHVPALVWAVLISLAGWLCPLTPLENWRRERGGIVIAIERSALGFNEDFPIVV